MPGFLASDFGSIKFGRLSHLETVGSGALENSQRGRRLGLEIGGTVMSLRRIFLS